MTIAEFCEKHRACDDGREWAIANCSTMQEAWETARREWLIWIATRPGVASDAQLRKFAVWSARQVQYLMTDQRSIEALNIAERFAEGDATDLELAESWDAARAAACDAADAADAAWAAAWAAEWAAADAAWAAAWAAARDAAWAAAWAAEWAAADAARAAGAAARAAADAARAAADAARDAALSAQDAWLRKNITPNFE